MDYRRGAHTLYLLAFLFVQLQTDLFTQYPPLLWLGMAGLGIVIVDAVICMRRRWRALRAAREEEGEDDGGLPTQSS